MSGYDSWLEQPYYDSAREDAEHEAFQETIIFDLAKACWKVENRADALAGADFTETEDYEYAFDDWKEDRGADF